jgi:uncharacterized protein (DUF1697 family)
MKHFVFLKGVNVGPTTRVDMKLLQARLEGMDLTASTFLNSGNVVVEGCRSATEAEKRVAEAVREVSDLDVAVVARTPEQVRATIQGSPFGGKGCDQSHALAYFGERKLPVEKASELGRLKGMVEEYQCERDVLHVHYPDGIGRSKFTTAWIDKSLGVRTTGRNLDTLRKLLEKFG